MSLLDGLVTMEPETKEAIAMSEQTTAIERPVREEAEQSGDGRGRAEAHGSSTRRRSSAGKGKSAGERNAELGRRGEDAAARFLDRRGYDIIERNWTCVAGEADIIARDGEFVVFVEVKTRSSCEKGLPSEAVDAAKRERYERIAALYLQGFDVVDVPVRFDVVSIVVMGTDRAFIRHHINAFGS